MYLLKMITDLRDYSSMYLQINSDAYMLVHFLNGVLDVQPKAKKIQTRQHILNISWFNDKIVVISILFIGVFFVDVLTKIIETKMKVYVFI